jgi:hypothetical protein
VEQEFDLAELLAAPIRALNEAEAAAAAHFVEILLGQMLETAAAPAGKAGSAAGGAASEARPRLRQLSFDIDGVGADGGTQTHSLTIPYVQLLPVGGMSIDHAVLNFGLTLRAREDRPAPAPAHLVPATRFSGRLAQSRGGGGPGSPSDANLDVEVRLRQMDMPQGLLDVIQHTQGATRSVPARPRRSDPPEVPDEHLFRIEVLRIEPDRRRRNPAMRMVLRVLPRPDLAEPVELNFAESPPKAFRLDVAGPPRIREAAQFELSLAGFTAESLAMLNSGRLGVSVLGRSIDDNSGAEVHQTLLLIPPSLTNEARP